MCTCKVYVCVGVHVWMYAWVDVWMYARVYVQSEARRENTEHPAISLTPYLIPLSLSGNLE